MKCISDFLSLGFCSFLEVLCSIVQAVRFARLNVSFERFRRLLQGYLRVKGCFSFAGNLKLHYQQSFVMVLSLDVAR